MKDNRSTFTLAAALAFCTAIGENVSAGAPGEGMVEISLLTGWRMDNGNHMAALRVALAPGWHTYWRAPGAAGIPPRFEWDGSTNVTGVQFHWPVPGVYEQNGMRFLGYEDELILPMEFTAASNGVISIHGQIELGVCEDVCIPVTAVFAGNLPYDGASAAQSDLIVSALANQPTQVTGAKCEAEAISDGMRIVATLNVPKLSGPEMAVLEHPDTQIWVSQSQSERSGRTLRMQSDMVPPHAGPFAVDRSQLRFTVIGDGRAFEAFGCTGQ